MTPNKKRGLSAVENTTHGHYWLWPAVFSEWKYTFIYRKLASCCGFRGFGYHPIMLYKQTQEQTKRTSSSSGLRVLETNSLFVYMR